MIVCLILLLPSDPERHHSISSLAASTNVRVCQSCIQLDRGVTCSYIRELITVVLRCLFFFS